jgi:hypothetical protein
VFVEINKELLRKTEPDLEKRWFRDVENNCDLLIWQNNENQVVRFQFWMEESLLEWNLNKGYKTGRIDQHTGAFRSYHAPLFRYHANFDSEILDSVLQLLNTEGENEFDDKTFELIFDQLEQFNLR